MNSRVGLASALLGLGLLAGCGGGSGNDGAGGAGDGANGGTQGANAATDPAHVDLSGSYELSSHFDLSTSGVFQSQGLNQTFQALADLRTNPAVAVIDVLQAANVPIVSTVLKWLPGSLKAPFEGWFNDFVTKSLYQNVPAADHLASLVSDLGDMVTQFDLVSTLDIPAPDANGNAQATHTFSGIAFTIQGARTIVPEPANAPPKSKATNIAVVALHTLESSPTVEDGHLEIGDHTIGIPYGAYAVSGVDALAAKKFGVTNLRDALGKLIDCTALAKDVSSKCLGPLCVGHESDIQQLCEKGLDEVANAVTNKVSALAFPIHFTAGEARMWDALSPGGAHDGKIDRIDGGAWFANVGQPVYARTVPSAFTGARAAGGVP